MAKSIWKFSFPITDSFSIEMSKTARVISVQTQAGQPCMWAEVHTDGPKQERDFVLRGTGHPLTGEEGRFIGTFQMHDGALVFHLYERLV